MQKTKKNYAMVLFRILELILIVILLIRHGTFRPNRFFVSGDASRGVDISHYHGEVDMDGLAEKGIDFIYIKATDGPQFVNEYYEENCRNAEEAGLLVGAYHFFSLEEDGRTQAGNFIQTVGNQHGRLIPAVHVEYYGDLQKNPPKVQAVTSSLQEFLDSIEEQYWRKPVIYTTLSFYRKYIKGNFDEYPLWIRDVYVPAGIRAGKRWTFWQYDDKLFSDGCQGEMKYVETDVFHGNREKLVEEMVMQRKYTYTFQKCSREKLYSGDSGSGFRNLYTGEWDTAEKHSLFIGQVITLFGEPEHQTQDNEDLFSQAVSAKDQEGNVLYLEVYYGPSGPAVAGCSGTEGIGEEDWQKAVDELAEYIMEAEPADFAWESEYGDTSVKLKMGVKEGKPYYETVLPKELEKAFLGEE